MRAAGKTLLALVLLQSAVGVQSPTALYAAPVRFTVPAPAGISACSFPSVSMLPDGRLICVYSAATSVAESKLSLYASYSSDNGGSWSSAEILLNTPGHNDYDSSIVVIGERVIVTSTATAVGATSIDISKMMAVRSEDAGRSWSAPYQIPMERRYTSGKTNNGIVLRDGTALLGYTWEKNLENGSPPLTSEGQMEEVNAVLISSDQGQTWRSSESVELAARRDTAAKDAINGVCEPAIIECQDGSILMMCRTGLTKLYSSRSADGGQSWSPPEATPLDSHNAPAALAKIPGDPAGIAVVWNNSTKHRWPLAVAASSDHGITWTPPREIANTEGYESSYPCCSATADEHLLVVYQQNVEGGREIRGLKFEPSWLYGDADANSPSTDVQAAAEPHHADSHEAAMSPRVVAHFNEMPKPLILSDDTWAVYFLEHEGPGLAPTPPAQNVYARYSTDRGITWSERETLFPLPAEAGAFGYFIPMLDQEGEVHFFILCDGNTGAVRPRPPESGKMPAEPLLRQRLDVWHAKSTNARKHWTEPRPIWEGRAGDLQSVTQLKSGRIILPLSYVVDRSWGNRGEGLDAFTYKGQFDTTVIYSDDGGASWHRSPSVLNTPTPDLASYGAVEPVVLQLNDGRVWMLMRTQNGRFYESFSRDGESWTPATPTTITSSDSPAGLTRLPDGRILMLWNNCLRHPYAQGSRHVLHAALSRDDGKTWSGYREIAQDRHRSSPPPSSGDHGVSYPFLAASSRGEVIFSLWVETGEGRSLWALDPDWLEQDRADSEFEDLRGWSTFGTRGVSTQPHPNGNNASVLVLEKSDDRWPAAAIWNFPQGRSGSVRARIRLAERSAIDMQLADHFSAPFDEQSKLFSLFNLQLASDTSPTETGTLSPNEWTELELRWNCELGSCSLLVNGVVVQTVKQQHVSPGPSYLRLVLSQGAAYPVGRAMIERVEADVSPSANDEAGG